jgi:hypothetical protein
LKETLSNWTDEKRKSEKALLESLKKEKKPVPHPLTAVEVDLSRPAWLRIRQVILPEPLSTGYGTASWHRTRRTIGSNAW